MAQFDSFIQAALDKWPNVPFLYGWLSLNQQGQWRLHPKHQILDQTYLQQIQGESISNQGLIRFLNRYYYEDENGAWFFQNGPQRVYVALQAAPWILHLNTDTGEKASSLITHTGITIDTISAWYMDEEGLFYAMTDQGFGLIQGRDMSALAEFLAINDDIFTRLATLSQPSSTEPLLLQQLQHPIYQQAPLFFIQQKDREKIGNFIALPQKNR